MKCRSVPANAAISIAPCGRGILGPFIPASRVQHLQLVRYDALGRQTVCDSYGWYRLRCSIESVSCVLLISA